MAKRVKAIYRLKAELRTAQEKAAEQTISAVRLNEMIARLEKQNNEKNETVAKIMAEVERQKDLVKRTEAERERIVRLVDQFTSIQITPFNTTTAVQIANESTPKILRRT